MRKRLNIEAKHGSFCGSPDSISESTRFFIQNEIKTGDILVLDFNAVQGISSSYANALVSTLTQSSGLISMSKVRFSNCSPVVKSVISLAITMITPLPEESNSSF
jgi:hypothetical protein